MLPRAEAFACAMASSRVAAREIESTGPKISSRPTDMLGVTLSRIVGPRKNPRRDICGRPSTTSSAPSATPASTYDATRSRCSARINGPTCTPCSSPGPTTILEAASRSGSSTPSAALPTATATDPARHRSPALPNAEFRIAGTASSRSASGMTTMWFFAPPSACTRLPFSAARRPSPRKRSPPRRDGRATRRPWSRRR